MRVWTEIYEGLRISLAAVMATLIGLLGIMGFVSVVFTQ